MNHYIVAGLGVLVSYICYMVVSSFLSHRYHARRASELGCKPAFYRSHTLPFGLDLAIRLFKADQNRRVPTEFHDIYNEVQHPTYEQRFLGTSGLITVDPKNIQALLATQFNDFSIGELRRNNFLPLLGNGIFTTDGKSW